MDIILRSKIKWIEEGEKNTKFFLSLEKRNYSNKLISTLDIDGKTIHTTKEISEAQTKFYENLYSEKINENDPDYKNTINKFLTNNNMPKLTTEQKKECDRPILEGKILNSIKKMSNGKTPGSDGLPVEFYKFFWINIKSLLQESILYAMEKRHLSIEQKRGIITLLPKKKIVCF